MSEQGARRRYGPVTAHLLYSFLCQMHNHPSIFLIGNEFRLQDASFRGVFTRQGGPFVPQGEQAAPLRRNEKQIPRRVAPRNDNRASGGSRGQRRSLTSVRAKPARTGRELQAQRCQRMQRRAGEWKLGGVKPPLQKQA